MAELVSIKRNVDVSPGQAAPAVFHCSQGDVGSKIILGLLNNGTAYAIPSGVTVTIEGSESNGSIFTPISATASGSDITFYLTGEMTAVAGPAICQAVLKSGSNILGTANFALEVESSPMGADAPPVFTDAGWTWMLNKLTTEFVPALGDNIIDAINDKLDKNQGTANAGKYLKVGADGNVETADFDVTTDKTLSIADKAADAKAVGDELDDLKADLNVNKTNSDYYTKDSILDFAELKSGVSVRHYQPLALKFGYIKADGTVRSDTDTLAYDTHYLSVNTGDFITSLGTRDAIRFICAYDSQKNPIVSSGSDTIIYHYRVPSGVSFVRVTLYTDNANDFTTMPPLKIVSTGGLYAVKEIENVTKMKNAHFSTVKELSAVSFGWINASGQSKADSDEVLAYSDYIIVNEGDVIKSNGIGHTSIRFVAAYDSTQTIVTSAGTNDPVAAYTVPSGVQYIRLTMYVETAHDLSTFPSITVEKSGNYILPIVDDTLKSTVYPAPAKVVGYLAIDREKTKSITRRGNLNASDKWTFEENNISTAKVLSFTAQISEFSAVQMGHGASESESNYIKIDASNVYEYGGGSVINTYPHGISIENTIQVKIEVKAENAYNAYLTLTSNGESFVQTMPRWYGDSGALFVESVGSVLTNCSFGWTCTNFTKPVYIFGDSYLGYATANRWAYYLLKDGYNQLIDGFGGRNSSWALKSMKNDLLHGTPKYIFWCMGMNDPDNGAVNASWLSCVTELLNVCTESGIIPVLATIPNVTKSDRDNTYKNAWIRNSGYRYVDFASAVNANVKGASWYGDMLNSDGLHPNASGAITLYHQVLSDFPEITIL